MAADVCQQPSTSQPPQPRCNVVARRKLNVPWRLLANEAHGLVAGSHTTGCCPCTFFEARTSVHCAFQGSRQLMRWLPAQKAVLGISSDSETANSPRGRQTKRPPVPTRSCACIEGHALASTHNCQHRAQLRLHIEGQAFMHNTPAPHTFAAVMQSTGQAQPCRRHEPWNPPQNTPLYTVGESKPAPQGTRHMP